MDHGTAVEHGLVARYRSGRLEPDEEQRFEEHFFACAACQDELEFQRRLELGLQAMAAEDAGATGSKPTAASEREATPVAGGGKLLRFPSRPLVRYALAAALLIAPLALFAWLWQSRATLEREASVWRERAQRGEAERKALAVRLAQSERLAQEAQRGPKAQENAEGVVRMETRIAEALPPRAAEPLSRPLGEAPLLLLAHLRGGEPSATANRLDLRRAEGIAQIALDAGAATGFSSYRATLVDARGQQVYVGEALQPNALEVILLTFPRDFFTAGEYRLRLEGRRADGSLEEIERYRFEVVR